MWTRLFVLIFAAVFSLQSAGAVENDNQLKGRISISGAWALYPMAIKWAEEFRKIHPDVNIDIAAGGAGKGMADALSKTVDLGMVSRSIYPIETEKGAWPVPVVKDAVAPVFNPSNPFFDQICKRGLSREKFIKCFLSGKELLWKDILGGNSDAEIHVYSRSDACGAAETWAAYLGGKQEDIEAVGIYGDPGLSEAVRKDSLGMGFNNINYLYDAKTLKPIAGVWPLPIDINNNGKIDPEENFYADRNSIITAIKDGRYPSPPARELYFVSGGKPTRPEVIEFLKWVMTEGQQFAPDAGYIPVSQEKLDESLKNLQGK
ncbi:MAG: phosphate ABC transporter substrate-binding protein [Lentisphaerae bacterium GWF2_45_14]|nr:MAG: phosphate ABC transporter substrate-binding protein [Lentisphaerae bacterium GWF2_45_14]